MQTIAARDFIYENLMLVKFVKFHEVCIPHFNALLTANKNLNAEVTTKMERFK